jgi:hypothetical protein
VRLPVRVAVAMAPASATSTRTVSTTCAKAADVGSPARSTSSSPGSQAARRLDQPIGGARRALLLPREVHQDRRLEHDEGGVQRDGGEGGVVVQEEDAAAGMLQRVEGHVVHGDHAAATTGTRQSR